ncbi:MAG: GntR family transcriptional regulator [Chitinivibrionales bacterium]|nr:GntR family transcriptional regulator [Chitinivibrionales bacterium]
MLMLISDINLITRSLLSVQFLLIRMIIIYIIIYVAKGGSSMQERTGTAVKRAIQYIDRLVLDQGMEKEKVLPPVAALCQRAGVSYQSMIRALSVLKRRGIVEGKQGRRYSVAPCAHERCAELAEELSSNESKRSAEYAWVMLARKLRLDLLTGGFSRKRPLPSIKELAVRYGSSYRPLKKALEKLREEGLLDMHKRTYRMGVIAASRSRTKVVFVTQSAADGALLSGGILNQDFIRALSDECSRAGIELEIIGEYHDKEHGTYYFAQPGEGRIRLRDTEDTIGYIFMVTAPPLLEGAMDWVWRELTAFRKPLAVLDVCGGWRLPSLTREPLVHNYSMAISSLTGKRAAQRIIYRGHKRIAYISPFHDSVWSHNRLEGLREIYAAAGLPDGVQTFVDENPPDIHKFYFQPAHARCDIKTLQVSYDRWKKQLPDIYTAELDSLFYSHIPLIIMPEAEFKLQMQTLFGRVAAADCSAWIACNDRVALEALTFARECGIAVPQELSVVGFDDSPQALAANLTSYNFNVRAMVHAMLDFVARPNAYRHTKQRRPFEVEGMLVERKTLR